MPLSRNEKIVIGVVAAAAVGGAVVLIAKSAAAGGPPPPPPPPGGIASLTLTSSVSSGVAPLTVTFNGTALTSTGAPAAFASVYFFVNNVLQNFAVPITTDANGAFAFQFTFTVAGTYACFVSSSPSGV